MLAVAAPNPSTARVPAFPGILANARYFYVASYDGDQFDPNLLPEDRTAIGAVQNAIHEWGKLIIVYRCGSPKLRMSSLGFAPSTLKIGYGCEHCRSAP